MIAAEFRDRLMSALHSSVDHLNSGLGPDEAVAKAASAADFNTEQTKRLCETFNTARTLYHYQAKPGEKEATFPLADQQAVLQAVFHARAPKEAEAPLAHDYSEYAGSEWMAHEGRLVEASVEELFPKTADAPPELGANITRAYKIIDTYRNLAKEAESVANQVDIAIERMFTKMAAEIADDFNVQGPLRYARFRIAAGGDANPMVLKLGAYLPPYVRLTPGDLLRADSAVIETRDIPWLGTLKEAQGLAERAANTRATGMAMAKEAKAFETALLDRVQPKQADAADPFDGMLSDFEERVKEGQTTVSHKDLRLNPLLLLQPPGVRGETAYKTVTKSKGGPGLFSNVGEAVSKGMGEAASDYMQQGLSSVFGAGAQESRNRAISERLRNQQREVILQDLMMTDPFISEADPQQVTNAYQTIMSVAPEVSTRKEVVRAILRQAVQSMAMDTFTASSVADLEKTIREISGTMPPRPVAGGPSR